ncbi:putative sugar phosphate isomerase YwlF [bioreactor metagenome]|mgnify:FL=1|jgi:ribose 5-phosphate isomerase B|uniref:Putative sugar phosphate isomerase YwlF n=1 Tax=bioreactor metagenome TaxID=1076179 RepID=A0A644U3A5_9ZZZZ|nr:ribose 5-phosphate isomerase B [Bacteroidales bacterium]WRQ33941.1 ribose 5-phosphate isomerase B [Bacteroidales bacterium MB20-C3-3]MBP6454628.1 ribose 5-phosphate isomerase B [Bacteroidales bacterium]MBP8678359.1 ribose 5-phosphate isomerase B [Bacteroidales bacterium]MBP9584954.1 ribose 5-phosphate isomerase B [Bacteroidales bacterium]
MKIGIASDHAGYELKEILKEELTILGYQTEDFGTNSPASMDYPDVAHPLAKAVENGDLPLGIAICGSGNGISMTVNKYPGIRAALCWNEELAKLARNHNNANILSLPARFITHQEAIAILKSFLAASFEGGRHETRINKIPCR